MAANEYISKMKNISDNSIESLNQYFKYYAISLVSNDLINKSLFFCFCKYDYYILADSLLKDRYIDVNEIIINSFYI